MSFPEEICYDDVQQQQMYKVNMEEGDFFEVDGVEVYPVVFTSDLKVSLIAGEPGDTLTWHTHVPSMDQVNVTFTGRARYILEQEGGDLQELEMGQGELIYLPGGARHMVEIVGQERHRELSIYGPNTVARLKQLDPNWEGYGAKSLPVSLWIDKIRDELLTRNERAVTE